MSLWTKLATMLGVRDDQVGDALADGTRARVQMDRRGFLLAGAALAAGALAPKALWSIPGAREFVPFDGINHEPVIRFSELVTPILPSDGIRGGRAIITRIDHGRGTITVDSGATIRGAETASFERGQMIILSEDEERKPSLRKKGDEYEYVQPMKLGRASGYIGKVTL